jgi:oxygen-independent coproporphyrinogen-3 oxidase
MTGDEPTAKLHASEKSMILATSCQNLQAGSFDGGEDILGKVDEPPPRQGAPKGRFFRGEEFCSGLDISLYFHIPFCSKKCPYCHFFVLPEKEEYKQPFVGALLKEWDLRFPQLRQKRVVSIYFGGGTPTKLPPSAYERILGQIAHSETEITLEANPEDVTLSAMQQYKAAGINRVSLGLQSLDDRELTQLGRTHHAAKAIEAVHTVHRAGISNISGDLMFELPRQTLASWEKTLRGISDLPLTHLSLYNLTIEPHTTFFKNKQKILPHLPSEELRLQMLQMAVQSLESFGLVRYEISAFAKPGMHSRHNTGYWTGRPFLGLGPSAFSYWEGARFSNVANFNKYLNDVEQGRLPVDFEERLPYPRNLQELFAVRLRLIEGVDLKQWERDYGTIPEVLERGIKKLIREGWIERNETVVKLTPAGQLFYDSAATELI